MILHVDRSWLLDVAHQYLRSDPDVTDYGSLAAAVARHADQVMDVAVYPEPHHRAAALMHLLVRVPALEARNELFGAVVAAAYLTASGLTITVGPKDAVVLSARVRDGLGVRDLAQEIKREWFAAD
ncbi:fic family toxin-antitoxin system, toxin component [Streptomyces scabiei]|uniref:fic family toxin-antitoxin system, toxin component n=1 Tax=Streptomyces scabiei TaxID=1930 RepID=UPI0029B2F5C7|nr:fic family toxin-antitoxin system, toxin component [Streptomyces scabiei]MDX3298692.1 fic family toxin-antitoxin system, toxin component [Streptomyces scabiei]